MNYTVQLIHLSGHIDTIEQLTYDPYNGIYITPVRVHIANAGSADDTVMLRVVGSVASIPDADSMVAFMKETMYGVYPTYSDTTLAVGTGGGILPPPDTCFYAVGPYENPSHPSENDVSILVHYCSSGSTITAQVYNSLGALQGPPSTVTSDAQVWDKIPVFSPPSPGSYYITVTVGSYSTSLGYTVY